MMMKWSEWIDAKVALGSELVWRRSDIDFSLHIVATFTMFIVTRAENPKKTLFNVNAI
jgi:hypothetical protein